MSGDLEPIAPEAARDLYLDARRDDLSDQTLQSHRYRLKPFVEWCQEQEIHDMNELTGRDLHAYRVHRREQGDLKTVSLRGQLSTLRVFLEFCATIDAVPEGLRSKVLLPSTSASDDVSKTKLDPQRAKDILEYVSRYEYASRKHVIIELLWQTGMRSGSLRALDLQDVDLDDHSLDVNHRAERDTPLKNQERGERMIAINGRMAQMLEAYIDGPRNDVQDEYGRDPLITTAQGRAARSTIRSTAYQVTRPCMVGKECPHDRDPDECEATERNHASKCPSSRSPHDLRSGAITAHLLDDVPAEIVSERMNVTRDVLSRHYDKRTEREKMDQRRDYLPDY